MVSYGTELARVDNKPDRAVVNVGSFGVDQTGALIQARYFGASDRGAVSEHQGCLPNGKYGVLTMIEIPSEPAVAVYHWLVCARRADKSVMLLPVRRKPFQKSWSCGIISN